MGNARVWLAAAVLAGAPVVAVVVLAAGGSGGGGPSGGGAQERTATVHGRLTLEQAIAPDTGGRELLVSLQDRRLNTLDTTGGATSVLLRCVDKSGEQTVRQEWTWPLIEEPSYPPHIHQPALPKVLRSLRSCRLTGDGIDFVGLPRGRLPRAR